MARRTKQQLEYARQMRRTSTWGEIKLWQELRRSQLGVRFRCQEPIGPYIADFACRARKSIVEIDGSSHDVEDPAYANRRDLLFRERGWAVVHFAERYVLENLEGTLPVIRHVLEDPHAQWEYLD